MKSRTENRRKKNGKKQSERDPNPASLDPSVVSYDAQGSYIECIRLTNQSHRGKDDKEIIIYVMIGVIEK